jgi:L-threonylcarbamoyladenylate synthase
MVTRGQIFDATHSFELAVSAAAEALRQGEVVVVPTESFYGLAVRADHAAGIARLCALKGRAPDKPLPLVAANLASVASGCDMPAALKPLAHAFWPGPLTLALPARGVWPAPLFAGGKTLGVRVSAHPFLQALAERAGTFITATSANLAGGPAVTMLSQVHVNLRAQCIIIDGGNLAGGMPSTVVGTPAPGKLQILRPGAITPSRLRRAAGELAWVI